MAAGKSGLSAAFHGLKGSAKKAFANIGKSMGNFTRKTAETADKNLAHSMRTEENVTKNLSDIKFDDNVAKDTGKAAESGASHIESKLAGDAKGKGKGKGLSKEEQEQRKAERQRKYAEKQERLKQEAEKARADAKANRPDGWDFRQSKDGKNVLVDDNKVIRPSGPKDENAVPGGRPTKVNLKDPDQNNIDSLKKENASAQQLAKEGYSVEQNPRLPHTNKNPDYRVEDRVFDSYAPGGNRLDNVHANMADKVDKVQTNRIVLNLDRTDLSLDQVSQHLKEHPIPNLRQVIGVKGGEIRNNILE